jgi:gamma-glutamyltranspeptidase / glutathione hydrolase
MVTRFPLAMGPRTQAAAEAPRMASFSFPATSYPNGYYPGMLYCEEGIPEETRAALQRMGHDVKLWPNLSWKAGGV